VTDPLKKPQILPPQVHCRKNRETDMSVLLRAKKVGHQRHCTMCGRCQKIVSKHVVKIYLRQSPNQNLSLSKGESIWKRKIGV
jgi:polyferredoxin